MYGLGVGLIDPLFVSDVSRFFVVLRLRSMRCGVFVGEVVATYSSLMLHDLCLAIHSYCY